LIGRGYELAIYDSNVRLSQLTGANRDHLTSRLPHIACLLREKMSDLASFAEVLLIGNGKEYLKNSLVLNGHNKIIIDLVRIDAEKQTEGDYRGICW
jgi:GDP-mannose 6-dehydrogenase